MRDCAQVTSIPASPIYYGRSPMTGDQTGLRACSLAATAAGSDLHRFNASCLSLLSNLSASSLQLCSGGHDAFAHVAPQVNGQPPGHPHDRDALAPLVLPARSL